MGYVPMAVHEQGEGERRSAVFFQQLSMAVIEIGHIDPQWYELRLSGCLHNVLIRIGCFF